jgi:hypothetical protein
MGVGGFGARNCGWFGCIVKGMGVRVWGCCATLAWGQDEFGWSVAVSLDEEHVAAGAVEQSREDLGGSVGAVLSEDAFVGDTSGDFDSGLVGDLA